jgi:hypothetical protein
MILVPGKRAYIAVGPQRRHPSMPHGERAYAGEMRVHRTDVGVDQDEFGRGHGGSGSGQGPGWPLLSDRIISFALRKTVLRFFRPKGQRGEKKNATH